MILTAAIFIGSVAALSLILLLHDQRKITRHYEQEIQKHLIRLKNLTK